MKAAYFLAAAANDFFGWPDAVQATLDAIPGEKNHSPRRTTTTRALVPGGTGFEGIRQAPGAPHSSAAAANWLAMEVPYFDYYLKGIGKPFPKVSMQKTNDAHLARFSVTTPHPLTKTEVYWAKAYPAGAENDPELLRKAELEREWIAAPARRPRQSYEAKLPPRPSCGSRWSRMIAQ